MCATGWNSRGKFQRSPSLRRTAARVLWLLLVAGCTAHSAPLHGMQYSPPQPAPNFTLTDQHGRAFSLADARGSAVLLYFGFTHCRDVCPQTLALLGKARERAKLTAGQARIVMVTIDPKRDSAGALRAFFRRIGVRAVGLRGSVSEISRIERAYGVEVQPRASDIAHTDLIFLIDPHGRIRETLEPQTPLKDVAADLRAVVQ